MRYLNERSLRALDSNYRQLVSVIRDASVCLGRNEFAQPIKPYLRYGDRTNRIIAMPAYVGKPFEAAGIKWIASFPGNLQRGIPRAHSVVVLNDAATGVPTAIINTPMLSVLRTAAVSGLVLDSYLAARDRREITLGITGWGPIGRAHYEMARELCGDRLVRTVVHDLRAEAFTGEGALPPGVEVGATWQDAYRQADVFMTCTVSKAPYIDERPKSGSLQLNVSLRDYTTAVFPFVKDAMIVDDWDEVCREATDIETFHKECGLTREGTISLAELVESNAIAKYAPDTPVMFNPMGMAVFDVALASFFADRARATDQGQELE
ncbi:hypothetical protein LZC95_33160 [Pendulispora brunnea]|uniref:Ornithine cyclodeaminase n=1 Tax=Pendulispora brunnea TaxID=2905690 RepID=A0ABZ2JXR6_9BACT